MPTMRSLLMLLFAMLATATAGWSLSRELSRDRLPLDAVAPQAWAAELAAEESVPAYEAPTVLALAATLEKPLFSPTRRPPQDAVPSADAAETEEKETPKKQALARLQAELMGVLVSSAKQVAILRVPGQDAPVYATVGQDVLGWTLSSLAPDTVEFERDGRSITLTLAFSP